MDDWVVLAMFLTISVGAGVAWLGRVIERWHTRSCLTVVVCEVLKNAHPLLEIISKKCCSPPEGHCNPLRNNDVHNGAPDCTLPCHGNNNGDRARNQNGPPHNQNGR